MKYNPELTLRGNLIKLLDANNTFINTDIFNAVESLINERNALRESHSMFTQLLRITSTKPSDIMKAVDTLRKERDNALERATNITDFDDGMRNAMQRIARACGKSFAVDIGYDNLPELVEELLARPDATQPQLSEIRYVLHGDIQPCSVLYSDDTTTLLRLDEGDMMLETDTIEWSDSVTYRCQELLKLSGLNKINLKRVSVAIAQLVRDERILLNDNGDEEVKPCVAAVVVPAPPPFPRGVADHNNPYVHTTTMFSEEAMRSHGWTNEALVSCGHGHYAPMQYPADMER